MKHCFVILKMIDFIYIIDGTEIEYLLLNVNIWLYYEKLNILS